MQAAAAGRKAVFMGMPTTVYEVKEEPMGVYRIVELKREGNQPMLIPPGRKFIGRRNCTPWPSLFLGHGSKTWRRHLTPLQGLRLEITQLRKIRSSLEELLDKGGTERLDKNHFVSAPRVLSLPVTDIDGLGPRSKLGKKLAGMTIADVAKMTREEFIELALKDVSAKYRNRTRTQAKNV
jgi:hypothetical protein